MKSKIEQISPQNLSEKLLEKINALQMEEQGSFATPVSTFAGQGQTPGVPLAGVN
jgi:hypothetical protein